MNTVFQGICVKKISFTEEMKISIELNFRFEGTNLRQDRETFSSGSELVNNLNYINRIIYISLSKDEMWRFRSSLF